MIDNIHRKIATTGSTLSIKCRLVILIEKYVLSDGCKNKLTEVNKVVCAEQATSNIAVGVKNNNTRCKNFTSYIIIQVVSASRRKYLL